jgi:hypothetical protein
LGNRRRKAAWGAQMKDPNNTREECSEGGKEDKDIIAKVWD